jgi:hypothetical protein
MTIEIIKTGDIVFDDKIYPRNKPSWILSHEYSEKIKTGIKFPPIIVGKYRNKKYLIDGYHRLSAYMTNSIDFIECEIRKYDSKEEMFIDSVKANATHGRPFTFQEKIGIVVRLEKIKVDMNTISKIIGISSSNIKRFKAERVTTNPKGESIVVKPQFKHLVEAGLDEEQTEANYSMIGMGENQIIEKVLMMVESGATNVDNKIIRRKLKKLYKVLKNIFEGEANENDSSDN